MEYRFDCVKEEYYQSLSKYRYLLIENNAKADGCADLLMFENIENWDLNCKLFENENTVPPGYSIGFQYLYLDSNDEVVGMINFRPKALEHPYLSQYGGHIGYGVRPDMWHQGIGKRMLKDFLPIVKEEHSKKYNIDKVLITCMEDNEASRRIIIANNGEFESKVYYPAGDGKIERYWIKL